jgi:hypothetical protein
MRRLLPLAFLATPLLLAAACTGYEVDPRHVSVPVGGKVTVRAVATHYSPSFGSGEIYLKLVSENQDIASVESGGTTPTHVVHGISPGVTFLAFGTTELVTVNVFRCPAVMLTPGVAMVQGRRGTPLTLQVKAQGYEQQSLAWFEETNDGWAPIAFTVGSVYTFTPTKDGVFHYQARYQDVCGSAASTFTVNIISRTRAVGRS